MWNWNNTSVALDNPGYGFDGSTFPVWDWNDPTVPLNNPGYGYNGSSPFRSVAYYPTNGIVLVSEDPVYQRVDHNQRLLLFGKKQAAPTAVQPFFLRYQSPPPSLFFDTFVSLYAKIDAYSPAAIQYQTPVRPFAQLYRPTIQLPEIEPTFFRFNHQLYFSFSQSSVVGIMGYTFDQPDFNDHPWLEWVHPAPRPETLLYPFRQIPQIIIGQPFHLLFSRASNWRVEAEMDFRIPDTTTINAFRWPTVIPVPPTGFRCCAVTAGFYRGEYYEVGDVFDLLFAADYSDSTIDYQAHSGGIGFGWMMRVPSSTPLYQTRAEGSPDFPAIDPNRRTIY